MPAARLTLPPVTGRRARGLRATATSRSGSSSLREYAPAGALPHSGAIGRWLSPCPCPGMRPRSRSASQRRPHRVPCPSPSLRSNPARSVAPARCSSDGGPFPCAPRLHRTSSRRGRAQQHGRPADQSSRPYRAAPRVLPQSLAGGRLQVTAQACDYRRRPLTATRVEIGATQCAAGSKGANALAAAGADMGTAGTHRCNQTTATCSPDHELLSNS